MPLAASFLEGGITEIELPKFALQSFLVLRCCVAYYLSTYIFTNCPMILPKNMTWVTVLATRLGITQAILL